MTFYSWPIHVSAALALFLGAGAEARGQEQVASGEAVQEKQPAEPSTLVLPARVRLTMADGRRREVELLQLEPGRAIVRASNRDPDVVGVRIGTRIEVGKSIALTEVTSAEISHGSHGHAFKGFSLGGTIGFFSGFVLGGYCEGGCSISFGDRLGAGAVVGLLFGGFGALIGAVIQTERWSDFPVSSLTAASPPVKADKDLPAADRQMRFAIGPTQDRGVQARFSISWR
jgi:hypothetical protein